MKKIILWVLISIIFVVSTGVITLACIKVDYVPTYSDPTIILVYQNGEQESFPQVLRNDQTEKNISYTSIYDQVKNGFKQNGLNAFFNGTLFKDYKVNKQEEKTIDYSSGTWIIYHYSTYSENDEKQFVRNNKNKIIDNATYTDILIKVEPQEEKTSLITFYLGTFVNDVFTSQYTYTSYGNLNQLVYLLNV